MSESRDICVSLIFSFSISFLTYSNFSFFLVLPFILLMILTVDV